MITDIAFNQSDKSINYLIKLASLGAICCFFAPMVDFSLKFPIFINQWHLSKDQSRNTNSGTGAWELNQTFSSLETLQ